MDSSSCQIHLRFDRYVASVLQHRFDAHLRQRDFQWRRHGLRAVLRPFGSSRRCRRSGTCAIPVFELARETSACAGDRFSWHRRSLVPCDGGPLGDPFNPVKPIFPDARKFVADWASRNRCAPKPTESSVALDIRRIEYARCANDAGVTFCTVHGGGHTWPGGERSLPEWHVGRTCNSIDATGLMWEFFGKHWLAKRP